VQLCPVCHKARYDLTLLWIQGHGRVTALAHPHPEEGCVNPPLAQECHHWPSRGKVPQTAAGPPMLIGGSEAFGGMQISPAFLWYPSVPLPVLYNPLIPPDWRRGGRQGEHSCWFVASRGPWLCQGKEKRRWGHGGSAAAVALIRGWASRPMSCTVHQRRSASQPESQMTQSTCTALPHPLPFIPHLPIISLLPCLFTVTCSSHSLTALRHPSTLPASSHLSVSHLNMYHPQSPVGQIRKRQPAECWWLSREWET